MKSISFRKTLSLLATSLPLALLTLAPLDAVAKDSPKNQKILAALEPFEDLTEVALDGSAAKLESTFKRVENHQAGSRALLSAAEAGHYDELFAGLETAKAKGDHLGMSLGAAELYKQMALALDTTALTTPTREVNLLDYISFRISALLHAPQPDWAAITVTVKEANGYWAAMRDQVGDHRLQSKMDQAQSGLATGALKQDASITAANVKKDGDLVDDLESYFAKQ
ncbi:MAG: hypothetical protein QM796_21040 [Chthoniobacteraceae bacterium]